MSSEMNVEKATTSTTNTPKPDDIAAALDEARQNARLLRVSSSLFLREAKELIDADKASVLVWASDFLEGSTEDAKERLEELQQSTTSCGLPSVSVESKKLLAELVGLGKIGGRVRRQAICLLAVMLDPAGEEAPALHKLLEQIPKGSLTKKKSVPVPPPVTPSTKAAPSKATVFRHHYTPDAPSFRAALSQKDSLPVLRRTGSHASSRRSSDAGQTSRPESALQDRTPAPIPEGAQLEDSQASSKASTPAPAAAVSAEPAPASGAALSSLSLGSTPGAQPAAEPAKGAVTEPKEGLQASEPVKAVPHSSGSAVKPAAPLGSVPGAQPAAEPAKGAATEPEQGLQASEPVKVVPHSSSSASAVKAATPLNGQQANGDAAHAQGPDEGANEGAAAPPTPSPAETVMKQPAESEASQTPQEKASHEGKEKKGAAAEQKSQTDNEPSARATVSLSQSSDTPTKPATQKEAADVYTPGAGMPEAPRRASAETPQQDPAARAGSIARPEEVSAFRMTRRRRSSAAAKAPAEPEKAPLDVVKAVEPAAPSSSPAEVSEDEDRPGPPNGKASEHRAEQGGKAAPPSLQDMMVPLEMNDAEAAKAVWTGTAVEPSPPGNT